MLLWCTWNPELVKLHISDCSFSSFGELLLNRDTSRQSGYATYGRFARVEKVIYAWNEMRNDNDTWNNVGVDINLSCKNRSISSLLCLPPPPLGGDILFSCCPSSVVVVVRHKSLCAQLLLHYSSEFKTFLHACLLPYGASHILLAGRSR